MPQGDRTGPMGQGSKTGRTLGLCNGSDTPGYTKGNGGGRGRGFAFGRGMGRGHGFAGGRHLGWFPSRISQFNPWRHQISKEDETRMLKAQAEALKREQMEIEKRLSGLENQET